MRGTASDGDGAVALCVGQAQGASVRRLEKGTWQGHQAGSCPKHQRPWVNSSDCCGIKSMLLVQARGAFSQAFLRTLASCFWQAQNFPLKVEITTRVGAEAMESHLRLSPG